MRNLSLQILAQLCILCINIQAQARHRTMSSASPDVSVVRLLYMLVMKGIFPSLHCQHEHGWVCTSPAIFLWVCQAPSTPWYNTLPSIIVTARARPPSLEMRGRSEVFGTVLSLYHPNATLYVRHFIGQQSDWHINQCIIQYTHMFPYLIDICIKQIVLCFVCLFDFNPLVMIMMIHE